MMIFHFVMWLHSTMRHHCTFEKIDRTFYRTKNNLIRCQMICMLDLRELSYHILLYIGFKSKSRFSTNLIQMTWFSGCYLKLCFSGWFKDFLYGFFLAKWGTLIGCRRMNEVELNEWNDQINEVEHFLVLLG